jgi:hypothetical protein
MFKNLFSKPKPVATKEVELPIVGVSGYPSIVDEIHDQFNIAGEKLLIEAKKIIANIQPTNEQKVKALTDVGFRNVKEVVETEAAIKVRKEKEELAVALEYFATMFPQYKFISPDMAMAICKKYDLVLGSVGQYKGFVPEKNLKQIERFYKGENEINTQYTKWWIGSWGGEDIITKEKYDQDIKMLNLLQESQARTRIYSPIHCHVSKRKTKLEIAAPLKDMKTSGYTLKDRIFSLEIPDPVVLAPVQHGNTKLYCIITAWGNEANDEIVINQKMN